MTYEIDLGRVNDRVQLHEQLKEKLALPAWYGNNLDALRDLLSESGEERILIFRNGDKAPEGMREYLARLRRMLDELQGELPGLTVQWEEKSGYLARAEALRAVKERHYNCAQSVLVPFAPDAGMDEETAYRVAANFGGGMKRASVCGAVTGGLMVLGLYGVDDGPTVAEYHRRLRENHDGLLDCADLLRVNKERGGDRDTHCDGMVYECAALVESLLRERGVLPADGEKNAEEQ